MISAVIFVSACYFVEFDTLICVSVFGSFLLQDMFLNLQAFAFEGQNMMLTACECVANLHSKS